MPNSIVKRSFVNWEEFIRIKVQTLHYWLNYVAGVGREDIVNEGAIKYGIAEYFSINCDPFTFEDYHNSLTKRRRIDLTFNVKIGGKTLFNVCEFKQVSEETYEQGELNRYFADLCRLFLFRRNYNGSDPLKTYFLVAGKTVSAYPLLPQQNVFNALVIQNQKNTPITDWLSFDINNPSKSFKLSEFKEYKAFQKYYHEDKVEATANKLNWLRGNNVIKTRLVHIEGTDVGEGGFIVAAWEIFHSNANRDSRQLR
jgi:hypothetical protein